MVVFKKYILGTSQKKHEQLHEQKKVERKDKVTHILKSESPFQILCVCSSTRVYDSSTYVYLLVVVPCMLEAKSTEGDAWQRKS